MMTIAEAAAVVSDVEVAVVVAVEMVRHEVDSAVEEETTVRRNCLLIFSRLDLL